MKKDIISATDKIEQQLSLQKKQCVPKTIPADVEVVIVKGGFKEYKEAVDKYQKEFRLYFSEYDEDLTEQKIFIIKPEKVKEIKKHRDEHKKRMKKERNSERERMN